MFITRRAMTALDEFRQLRGDANPSVFGKTTNRWVKAATQAAGLGEGFSGHSGRVGLARAGDHAAGPVVRQCLGGEVNSGRVRPVAGMRGMSQPPFGAVAVLTVRYYRPQHERSVQQPSGLGRHGSSAHGRQRTLRSAQRTRGLASLRSAEIPSRDRPSVPGPRCRNTSSLTRLSGWISRENQ